MSRYEDRIRRQERRRERRTQRRPNPALMRVAAKEAELIAAADPDVQKMFERAEAANAARDHAAWRAAMDVIERDERAVEIIRRVVDAMVDEDEHVERGA